jgi:ribosomal protein S18 acetylase RimI-like enzyme
MISLPFTLTRVKDDRISEHILDNPVWAALSGPHSGFSEVFGRARRYPSAISRFAGIDEIDDPQSWRDLATLLAPEGVGVLIRRVLRYPEGWKEIFGGTGVQMIGDRVGGEVDEEAVVLTEADVVQMIDLVARTEPGPFEPRTIDLGGYIGFKEDGKLVAMAGCRMRPSGWREISAVCTDPDFRGKGMGGRLVKNLVANIRAEGDVPFLHASSTNTNAIRLYEKLGFEIRTKVQFAVLQRE